MGRLEGPLNKGHYQSGWSYVGGRWEDGGHVFMVGKRKIRGDLKGLEVCGKGGTGEDIITTLDPLAWRKHVWNWERGNRAIPFMMIRLWVSSSSRRNLPYALFKLKEKSPIRQGRHGVYEISLEPKNSIKSLMVERVNPIINMLRMTVKNKWLV